MHYGTHATDIVAYAWQAAIYAPDCIGKMFERRDGETTDAALERYAADHGIDSAEERDADVFPQPVFGSEYDPDEPCMHCLMRLGDH